jgi:hypothetical protein
MAARAPCRITNYDLVTTNTVEWGILLTMPNIEIGSAVQSMKLKPARRHAMCKIHTEKMEKADTRNLSVEEIECVVGGVAMTPDGRSCTERSIPSSLRWLKERIVY